MGRLLAGFATYLPFPALVGLLRCMSVDVGSAIVEDHVIEHLTAARYFEVRKEAGPRRAADNDKWLAQHGNTYREKLRAAMRAGTGNGRSGGPSRVEWRRAKVAFPGERLAYHVACEEVAAFGHPLTPKQREAVKLAEERIAPIVAKIEADARPRHEAAIVKTANEAGQLVPDAELTDVVNEALERAPKGEPLTSAERDELHELLADGATPVPHAQVVDELEARAVEGKIRETMAGATCIECARPRPAPHECKGGWACDVCVAFGFTMLSCAENDRCSTCGRSMREADLALFV